MDSAAVLAAFNDQIRRSTSTEADGGQAIETAHAVRRHAGPNAWNGVVWSDLDESNADQEIADQVAAFGCLEFEWKYYSYDQPADLPDRLLRAGFVAEPEETVLVAEIAELDLDVRLPAGVELRPITDEAGIAALVEVSNEAFGDDHSYLAPAVRHGLTEDPPTVAAVVAMAGDRPVSGGRLEMRRGTDFASIWGGGTAPEWRGKGIFRALVAHRAATAAAAGFRYLQVDALPTSRPILERLGFIELATTTPYVRPATR